ncbi:MULTISPECIES: TrkH family potassium uptake protein [Methanosarcina]|uniref:Potassium uptake protein TrkH n=3 Tax=Methanosarcina barkeri TaxID=2208 RepID=A0A0E3QU69_METBA|nr:MULTISPECIES: TrkH family potassium uptake protein [Methanosarcina]AKB54244.1 Potassium uptake protein TrkH [Methanosarcina barkeri MS]AKB57679.1 Potassium uptake protein TrkH [Methanosarcina barkeri 227]AKJ38227.1 potassium uptake protein TrkH1 [Methanosarcina barkeri CM1]OEC90424.1 potassium transporter [Methanosarcina sp. A14]
MNFRVVLYALGGVLRLLGLIMLVPLGVAYYYGESLTPFLVSILITTLTGFLLLSYKTEEEWMRKEGFAIVALSWLAAAVFGAIPFMLDGISPLNAVFESMSGFTTTGSTILTDIESHPKGILFWRGMIQWLGGMGIIVLFIAILPKLGVAGRQLFRAEAPGPTEDKLKPRIKETARILWVVYFAISLLQVIALLLAGVSLYDAINHTFTTMSCGGFSNYALSVEAFHSPLIEFIITFFMFIAGANFALHYRAIYIDKKFLLKDDEFRFYTVLVLSATALLAILLWRDMGTGIFNSFRFAIFQIVSIITTTGFATVDFNLWPDSAKMVLITVMFIGGCAGSTGGGMKVVRILILLRYSRAELFKAIHPKAIKAVKFNNKNVPDEIVNSIVSFVVIYLLIFLSSTLILSVLGMDIITSFTASIATLGNIGPGLNVIGPMGSFDPIPALGKLVLIANMWIGRLEVYTVILLFTPEFWSK